MRLRANRDRDFTEWHGGCRRALVWAVDADLPEVRDRIDDARSRLDPLLIGRYQRQPHITIAFAGLEPEPGATPAGRLYHRADAAADAKAISDLALPPFSLTVGGWATFPFAPYMEVAGEGPALLRETLGSPTRDYVPHVTIGLYCVAAELADVEHRMAGFSPPPLEVSVDRVHLFAYETADIAGPLTTVGTLDLRDGSWQC